MAEFLTPDICVIGGGAGGLAVATRARAYGASVVLIEPGKLGGENLHAGAIPSKALVAAARRAHYLTNAGPFGIANAEPKINARGVFDHVHTVIAGAQPTATPEYLAGLGIELIAGAGRFIDRRTVEAAGQRIRARRFVIATGSRGVVPEIAGLSEVPYFTSTSIFDNPRKLTHLVIVGGGAVAIELAQAFRRLGSDVTLVDAARPLAGSDSELTDVVLRRLADEGVLVRPATEVTAVQMRSLGIGVGIKSAAGDEVLDASHILVALGRVPQLDGLGLEKAGVRRRKDAPDNLSLRPNLRTTNRLVYAVGDAVGGEPRAHTAGYHANLVVRSALLGLPARIDPKLIPSAVFSDPELAEVGITEPQLAAQRGKYRVLRFSLAENDRARVERESYGFVKLVVDHGGRLLGAGIVGTGAGEMISLFAFAIANRMSVHHFRNFVAPYPTLTEVVRHLAEEAARPDLESPWLRRLLALKRMLP